MSFSENIKNELLASKNKKCCIMPLRYGELITESKEINIKDIKSLTTNLCCKKAFLKGVFLGSGCVTNPNKDYHFEVIVKSKAYSDFVIKIMEEFNTNPKSIKRGQNYVIYLKDAESISRFLAIVEANKAVLEYENIRISKSLKNDINRSVNCETANLNKVVLASVRQIEAIKKLKMSNKFDLLNEKLKEAANLRLKNEDSSLDELVKLSNNSVSKSGLYHRFEKIIKLAEEK